MQVSIEAWLDRTKPIEIATPIFQRTVTTLLFTVLQASRTPLNLQGYAGKFSLIPVDTEEVALDKAISIVTAASGICKVDINAAELSASKECVGELRLWSSSNISAGITHRVQFRINVVKASVQGVSS